MSAQTAMSAVTVAQLQAQVTQLQEALRLMGHAATTAQASAVSTCSCPQQAPDACADIRTSVSAQLLQLGVSTHSTQDSTGSAQHKQHTGRLAANQSNNTQHKQHTFLHASDQSCSAQHKQHSQLATTQRSTQGAQHSTTQRMQDTQLLADSICWVTKQPILTSCSAQYTQLHAPTKPLTGHHTRAMDPANISDLDAASTHQQGSSTAVYSKAQAAAPGQSISVPSSCCDACPVNHTPKLPLAGTAGQQQLGTGAGATPRFPAVEPLRDIIVGSTKPVNVLCIPTHSPARTSSQPEPAHLDVSQLCSAAFKQITKLWGSADVSTFWWSTDASSESGMLSSCADESELASHAFWEVVTDLF